MLLHALAVLAGGKVPNVGVRLGEVTSAVVTVKLDFSMVDSADSIIVDGAEVTVSGGGKNLLGLLDQPDGLSNSITLVLKSAADFLVQFRVVSQAFNRLHGVSFKVKCRGKVM
jgi:hypothetical protein